MPPKRKQVHDADDRPTKRTVSGTATPASTDLISSDEEYSDSGGSSSGVEEGRIRKNDKNFAVSTYTKKDKQPKDSTSALFRDHDLSGLPLKPDHEDRPLWIDCDHGTIILESFSTLAKQAQDFLTTVAEPSSRPHFLHEYRLTTHSLYAAVSVGVGPQDIISNLEKFSKTALTTGIRDWIWECTARYGTLRLVLRRNCYFIESSDASVLQRLLQDEVIGPCRIEGTDEVTKEKASDMAGLVIPGTKNAAGVKTAEIAAASRPEEDDGGINDEEMYAALRAEDDDDEEDVQHIHSFQITRDSLETVRKRCGVLGLPIGQEYDFRNDEVNANLDIDLRPMARIRDYQEKSLSKMFGNGRAKSGIIVLPCGAGKTLVGITAACTVKKGVIVLCTSSMSVVQWQNEFIKWSNINPNDIAIFTADHKDKFSGDTGVIISTYNMVAQTRGRSYDSQKMMDFITGREWGLMILDEVHVVPAALFRKVSQSVGAHSKLGLTATLLREDDKITDLNYLIGPKLYEANWLELANQGHIARVQCAEVWCPMTAEFYTELLKAPPRKRPLLCTMNPRKFQACQFLIDYHERRGDKTIVFSDNVYTLEAYAKKLHKFYIFGGTAQQERMRILENFQHNEQVNTIFLSKIGDTSLDLPEATCLIQISSHYGSRRQEAQRLGRILRAKRRNDEGFNAFFYSLVSKDTQEMVYSSRRQAFLVDQGYSFKVITDLQGIEKLPGLAFTTASERKELLLDVLMQSEWAGEEEQINDDMFAIRRSKKQGLNKVQKPGVKRMAGSLSELAGAEDMAYIEYNKSRNKELRGKGHGNTFIQKLRRENQRRRQGA